MILPTFLNYQAYRHLYTDITVICFNLNFEVYLIKFYDQRSLFLLLGDVTVINLKNISNPHHYYVTSMKKKAGPMLPETKKILKAFFKPHNEELVKILNDSRYSWSETHYGTIDKGA